jgi:hypothetical protein
MRSPRPRKNLSDSIDRQLNMYRLAAEANRVLACTASATAVGASALGLSSAADAKIIYTPTHVRILPNHSLFLDFKYGPKGGEGQFSFARSTGCSFFKCVSGLGVRSYGNRANVIAATAALGYAVALHPGERMGPGKRVSGFANMADHWVTSKTAWDGQWGNGGKGLENGYLGLRFTLNGGVHYGWARLTVTVRNNKLDTVTLTGYAFETIPNRPIIIGKTKGPDVTLGMLAVGRK